MLTALVEWLLLRTTIDHLALLTRFEIDPYYFDTMIDSTFCVSGEFLWDLENTSDIAMYLTGVRQYLASCLTRNWDILLLDHFSRRYWNLFVFLLF